MFFGTTTGKEVDKFKESGIEIEPAKYVKVPLLKEATFNFECKLYKEIEAGDHFVFIGEILASYWNEGKKVMFNMGKKDGKRVFQEL